jgi:hypothetical protein
MMAAEAAPLAIPETVTLSSEVVLDTVAALHALDEYFSTLTGIALRTRWGADSRLGEWCTARASALQAAAFGESPEEDDAWIKDPIVVERYARGENMAADLLEIHVEEQTALEDERTGMNRRIERLRVSATRTKEAGLVGASAEEVV